jgi:hypothetical protein
MLYYGNSVPDTVRDEFMISVATLGFDYFTVMSAKCPGWAF